jgi:hypothetical protein
MLKILQESDIMTQGFFIAGMGLLLVFAVLVLFFLSIRLLEKMGKKQ